MKDVIAIIPARSGSKGVPQKNILALASHPLISYAIIAAKNCKNISRVIVSTDSLEIAEIAKKYGAEVPFLRPAEFSTDTSTDKEFLLHAIKYLQDNDEFLPEYLVHLRPTSPLRDPTIIDSAILKFKNNSKATSLRSSHLAIKNPYKFFEIGDNDFYRGIRSFDDRVEYYNLPRQNFPAVYDPNGYIDILRVSHILKLESVHGPFILPFITDFCHDIDSLEDFEFLTYWIERHGSILLPLMAEER